jgi:hypothetical protein
MDQEDSSGAKHMDPSDITANMCLDRTEGVEGSEVMFYGTKTLQNDESDKDESFSFLVLVNVFVRAWIEVRRRNHRL